MEVTSLSLRIETGLTPRSLIRVKPAMVAIGAITMALFGMPQNASASVDVEGVHSQYDACIGKFRAAGLPSLVNQLDSSQHVVVVELPTFCGTLYMTQTTPDSKPNASNRVGTGSKIEWNPAPTLVFKDGISSDGCADLYHEMQHAALMDKGNDNTNICSYYSGGILVNTNIPVTEVLASRAENVYRHTQDLHPRGTWDKYNLPPVSADCVAPPPPPPTPVPNGAGCSISGAGVGCTGRSYGDPHIVTLNGYGYDMQAAGEFVLTRSTDGAFEVQARAQPLPGRDDITLNTAVAIKLGTHRLVLYAQAKPDKDPHSFRLDGKPVAPPEGQVSALPDGSSISVSGLDSFVQMPSGERITLQTAEMGDFNLINVNVTIPLARSGKYVGILGDGSGNTLHDLRTRDGHSIALANTYSNLANATGLTNSLPQADAAFHIFVDRTFADSWRVSQTESLFDYAPGTSTATFTDKSYPRSDFTVASGSIPGARQACLKAGVSQALLPGCIIDIAATGNSRFAQAIAHAQSLVNVPLGSPAGLLRSIIPGIPNINIPELPKFPLL